jgi:EKC/KEOPS complex subunit PCC1/LAGE3
VKREFVLVTAQDDADEASAVLASSTSKLSFEDDALTVLMVHYKATTPRMLRVAVNGFFESVGLIVQVMEELDVDVLHEKGIEGLEGVQGVEQGMTGSAGGVAG